MKHGRVLSTEIVILLSAGLCSSGLWAEENRLALSPEPVAFPQSVPTVQPVPAQVTKAPVISRHRARNAVKRVRRDVWAGAMRLTSPLRGVIGVWFGEEAKFLPSHNHLPKHLRRGHDDYPVPFSFIPRSWTAFYWGEPRLILGNQQNALGDSPKPIGEPGSYQISRYPDLPFPFSFLPLYFSFTTPNGWHMRLGARWDDVDDYTQVPTIAFKRNVKE